MGYGGDVGGVLALAQGHIGAGRGDGMHCPLAAGHGLLLLCLQCVELHACQWLAGGDEVTFLHQDLGHPAGVFAGHIDFGGFDAAVAVDQAFAGLGQAPLLPAIRASGCDDNDQCGDGQFFVHG